MFYYFRLLVPDGRNPIGYSSILASLNTLYTSIGHPDRVTGKSAKCCGVSTAFKIGLTNDEIRVLGRWKSVETPQFYREIDPGRISNVSKVMNMALISGNKLVCSPVMPPTLTLSTLLRPREIVQEPMLLPRQLLSPKMSVPLEVQEPQLLQLPKHSAPILNLCPVSGRLLPAHVLFKNPPPLRWQEFSPTTQFYPPRKIPVWPTEKPVQG